MAVVLVLLALPALAALVLVGVRAGRERRAADTPGRRRDRAAAAARERLADDADGRAVERALRAFLADRFGIAPTTRSRAALDGPLADAGVSADVRSRLYALLDACTHAQFAPGGAGARDLRADAEAVLDALARPARQPGPRAGWRRFGRRARSAA